MNSLNEGRIFMNRKKVIAALCLQNVAVLVVATAFLQSYPGFGLTGHLKQAVRYFVASVAWGQLAAVMASSILLSVAVYLFTTGLFGERSGSQG